MDMTESIRAKSDQLDADDLLGGPLTATITEVTKGPSPEQPFNFKLAEFPRPWRPCKTVRRLIVAAWGPETTTYHGRKLTLVRDPNVTWAGEAVGGIRVSHMSHLQDGKPLRVSVQATSKTKAAIIVQPLPDAPPPAPQIDVATETDVDKLRSAWKAADADTRAAIKARVDELTAAATEHVDEPSEDQS